MVEDEEGDIDKDQNLRTLDFNPSRGRILSCGEIRICWGEKGLAEEQECGQ